MTLLRSPCGQITLSVALWAFSGACSANHAEVQLGALPISALSKRMPDGSLWTTRNLALTIDGSYCYDDEDGKCRRYGRLDRWEAAVRACRSLGAGWRLPTDDEWRGLATRYGGVSDASADSGKAAYAALITGGESGFDAQLGGRRDDSDGRYSRIEAHGFYWTASASDSTSASYYNFGRGGLALHRQTEGPRHMALSARCRRSDG